MLARYNEQMSHPWPFFGLTLTTPNLTLRYPDDDDIAALGRLAAGGIHPPDEMPFAVPWSAADPAQLPIDVAQFHWQTRGSLGPDSWHVPLAVVTGGVVGGTQALEADAFAVRRTVVTGSWLGREFQGRGIGPEMRAAVLHMAFAGLGAERAESTAFLDNPASHAVSRALGYAVDGTEVKAVRGRPRTSTRYLLTRERWLETDRIDVEIAGLEPCLALLGAG
jgi:RimJ/RimL family protein N-acetyltransferase